MTEHDTINLVAPPAAQDRRRPGRRDISAELIPLLRDPLHIEISPAPEPPIFGSDQTSPARGIAIAVLLSIPLWMLLVALVRLVF